MWFIMLLYKLLVFTNTWIMKEECKSLNEKKSYQSLLNEEKKKKEKK